MDADVMRHRLAPAPYDIGAVDDDGGVLKGRIDGSAAVPINPLAVSRYRDRYVVSRDLGVSLVGMAAGTRRPWVIPA